MLVLYAVRPGLAWRGKRACRSWWDVEGHFEENGTRWPMAAAWARRPPPFEEGTLCELLLPLLRGAEAARVMWRWCAGAGRFVDGDALWYAASFSFYRHSG